MEIGVVTTKKPWTMLVFALVAINAIVALGMVAGTDVPLLGDLTTQPTMMVPETPQPTPVEGQYNPQVAGSPLVGAAIFLLILNVLILWGLTKGHVWSWWLLTFISIATLVGAVIGFMTGNIPAILAFVVNVLLVAALLKKEVVQTYKPQLNILPQDGVW